MHAFHNSPRRAFTLIELLTVIAIIGILAAILIPTVGKVRESANSARCASNLRQIGLAVQSWSNDNRGRILAGSKNGVHTPGAADSWVANIVRYLQSNQTLLGGNWPAEFRCPVWSRSSDPNSLNATPSNTSFVGYAMVDPDGMGGSVNRARRLCVGSGSFAPPSRFLYVVERSWFNFWMGRPEASIVSHLNTTTDTGLARHGERSNYLFLDGSVRSLALPDVVIAWNATVDMLGPF